MNTITSTMSQINTAYLKGERNIFGEENSPEEKSAQLESMKKDRMSAKPQPQWLRAALDKPANFKK